MKITRRTMSITMRMMMMRRRRMIMGRLVIAAALGHLLGEVGNTTASKVTCEFENETCDFSQGSIQHNGWFLHCGWKAGPKWSPGIEGNNEYAYLKKNQKAGFIETTGSCTSTREHHHCLAFHYRLQPVPSGHSVNGISVYQKTSDGKFHRIWAVNSSGEDGWRRASVPVLGMRNFTILIQGLRQVASEDVVAIDNIRYERQPCRSPSTTSFRTTTSSGDTGNEEEDDVSSSGEILPYVIGAVVAMIVVFISCCVILGFCRKRRCSHESAHRMKETKNTMNHISSNDNKGPAADRHHGVLMENGTSICATSNAADNDYNYSTIDETCIHNTEPISNISPDCATSPGKPVPPNHQHRHENSPRSVEKDVPSDLMKRVPEIMDVGKYNTLNFDRRPSDKRPATESGTKDLYDHLKSDTAHSNLPLFHIAETNEPRGHKAKKGEYNHLDFVGKSHEPRSTMMNEDGGRESGKVYDHLHGADSELYSTIQRHRKPEVIDDTYSHI